jgi:hypothetical protein
MRVYVSSRMRTADDLSLRTAARDTVSAVGHQSLGFEDIPPTALPPGQGIDDENLPLVRGSDFVIVVVRDEVTQAMAREVAEARSALGDANLAYFFEKSVGRDRTAEIVLEHARRGYIYGAFGTEAELRSAILRMFGGLAEGGLRRLGARRHRGFSGRIQLAPGQTWQEGIDVPRDGSVSVQVRSPGFFKALLLSHTEWQRHQEGEPLRFWSEDGPTREFSRIRKSDREQTWTLVVSRDDLPLPEIPVDVDLNANYSALVDERPDVPGRIPAFSPDGGLPIMVGGQPLMLMGYPKDWGKLDPETKTYFAKTVVVYLRAMNQNRQPVEVASHDEIESVVRFYDLVASGGYTGREGYPGRTEAQLLSVARSHGFLPGIDLDSFDTRRWIGLGRGLPRIIDSRGNPASIRRGRPR